MPSDAGDRVLITGATGLIGGALCDRLVADGVHVAALSRRGGGAVSRDGVRFVNGDVSTAGDWQTEIASVDAVVHLAGEPVSARRWTASVKARIRDSRIEGTRRVVEAIARAPARAKARPRVLVCASAAGYYGPRGNEELDESAAPGSDFLARLCVDWENEARRAVEFGVRVVHLRFGLVLSADGGALPRMLTPFRLGVGGPLGPADRFVPWIHLDDVVGIARLALEDRTPGLQGPVNVVAPEEIRMGGFANAVGRALRRPAFVPVPEFALRMLLGEATDAVVPGQRVIPRAALAAGYRFAFPTLGAALDDLLRR